MEDKESPSESSGFIKQLRPCIERYTAFYSEVGKTDAFITQFLTPIQNY